MSASDAPNISLWDHPELADWQREVRNGDTLRGFASWLAMQAELRADRCAASRCATVLARWTPATADGARR